MATNPPPPPPLPLPGGESLSAERLLSYEDSDSSKGHGHQYVREPLKLEEEIPYLLTPLLPAVTASGSDRADDHGPSRRVITFVHDICPVIQSGPMCGLVALSMASALLHGGQILPGSQPGALLDFVKENLLSKQGEMFSVDYMLRTAKSQLQCRGKVANVDSMGLKTLLETLLKSRAILLPYDADKNHSPCLKNGHKAHWCLLVGFALIVRTDHCTFDPSNLLECCEANHTIPGHCTLQSNSTTREVFVQKLSSLSQDDSAYLLHSLFVFARHGKSRHLGLWQYSDLVMSNKNLFEVGPHRISGEYVVPEGGIVDGLCSKLLVLYTSK